ncbi:hypothetical protein [Altericista sp. CCNU0014]|uniref:hypothetical protein n=1 Tax=Altericista sp. CCNU0014 TaxID=3082949 RepID=UPI00384EDA5B
MGLARAQQTDSTLTSLGQHPLPSGSILHSPGGQFRYRIIGPCCRLFDREQLPWPCCRIQWHSKEPSWRRIGNRFVADMAAKRYPSYSVELVGYENTAEPTLLTLYTDRLLPQTLDWWYARPRPSIPTVPPVDAPKALLLTPPSMQIALDLGISIAP